MASGGGEVDGGVDGEVDGEVDSEVNTEVRLQVSANGGDNAGKVVSVSNAGGSFECQKPGETAKKRRLLFMRNKEELSHCITEILRADPRSTYRRGGGGDKQYQEKFKHITQGEGEEKVVEKSEVNSKVNSEVNNEVNSEVNGAISTKVNVFSFPVDNVEVHVKVVECVATVLTVQHTVYVNSLWGEEGEEGEEGEDGKSRTKRRRRRRKKN